jgi:RecJ-like exonuclease
LFFAGKTNLGNKFLASKFLIALNTKIIQHAMALFNPKMSYKFSTMALTVVVLLGTIALSSCVPTVSTSTIQTQPLGQTVEVKGKVITIAPMINQVAYEVKDSAGSIWVMSQKQPPKLDSEISIVGQVKFESIQVEGQEIAERYILED